MKEARNFLSAIIFLTAFLIPLLAGAQDTSATKSLSLQEAIDLSIKNSNQLKASQARIEQATGALQEAKDNKLPECKC